MAPMANAEKGAAQHLADKTVQLHGTMTQGSLLRGQVPVGTEVVLDGEPVRVNKQGKFVIGFERKAELSHRLEATFPDGTRVEKPIELAERAYNIQRIDGLDQKMVSPPESVLARIKQDNIDVAKARSQVTDLDAVFTRFQWPAKGPITGVYGSQRILNGTPKWPHYGVDVGGATGTKVTAPASGTVTLAQDLYYSGNTLIIDHGMGVFSTFLHLNAVTVKVGDKVAQGEQIGTIGATGRATGPHLDWRINWRKMRLDPQTLVSGLPQ
ncbi:peptidoglycan DD-metalloendopeptidase family protein [Alteromonas sp. 345S023]|uniref:Peptidoglycan DD-metalloendopeptidase family protein n=2 Tax=Alteromonas profundi TaxID=2696062 RepID=A0A7X5LPN3_9ALTE|nr:peptidoglycan DD-metalloendopeptidase family protein [Alteromonas profundi]